MAVLFSLGISNADAQTIRENSRHQKTRIAHGKRNGEITKREAFYLGKEQRKISKEVRKARSNDGRITARERFYIRKDQRKSHRHIARARHNNRNRF